MFDKRYSQNRYRNNNILSDLIKSAKYKSNDIILDIGSGNGNIANELSKYSNNVLAYELDIDKIKDINAKVLNEDFLNSKLPIKEFRVFSNIPFNITSEIISKLTEKSSNLDDAYLFVQKESAYRYIGRPYNTQVSAITYGKYDLDIVKELNRYDFDPIPNVDIVVLYIKKNNKVGSSYDIYRDFITYIFNQRESNVLNTLKKLFTYNQIKYIKKVLDSNRYTKPSDISNEEYINMFNQFIKNGSVYKNKVLGSYDKHVYIHRNRVKENRTRNIS